MAVKAPKADKPSAGFSVYLGPSLAGVIQTMTIYPVGRDDALKLPELALAVEKKPGIADLVVDGQTLPEDRIKVKTPGEELYEKYRSLRKK
jgi:hypothetical protein